MAYTDDSVKAKLSALNETQESIVTVGQWIMFHRKYADRTAQLWLQRLKDSGAGKRLNLIYLANEVAQQSKARKKDDFLIAFSPIIADATATAYKGATYEVQQKIRRVVEVWRQRQIFETPIQEAIENRVNDIDKSRSSGKKPLLGGSIFSSSSGSAPPELQPLVAYQITVTKATLAISSTVPTANVEYEKLMDPNATAPTPPVHAARLSALLKNLSNAEGAVWESIKAREALVAGLESFLQTSRAALNADRSQHEELMNRKRTAEAKKREVEDGIMRGLSNETPPSTLRKTSSADSPTNGKLENGTSSVELERPQMEELTPPPVESLTPVESPKPAEAYFTTTTGADTFHIYPPNRIEPPPPPSMSPPSIQKNTTPGADLLSSLSMPPVRSYASSPTNGGPVKKRKIEDSDMDEFVGGDAMADLDDDVAELLRAESGGA